MELVHECTYRADLAAPLFVGAAPLGTRVVVPVTGGWVRGERVNGSLVGGGADWLLVGPDGFGTVDVRAQIQTDDGALLYAQYFGVLEMNDAVNAATAMGGETDFADQYFRVAPRIETGDERYAWVNRTLFVAEGRIVPGGVEYELYRLT